LLLLLLELQPKLVERTLFVRTAAHPSCWKDHLPSHGLFPIRRSATAVPHGQLMSAVAIRFL
jgi:hypothetical protein